MSDELPSDDHGAERSDSAREGSASDSADGGRRRGRRGQYRAYCFTLNNPTQQEEEVFRAWVADEGDRIDYCIVGRETAPETGTEHFQGYCRFRAVRTWDSLKAALGGRAHIERARGSTARNREYCTKGSGGAAADIVLEHGEARRPGQRTDIERFGKRAREGASDLELMNEFIVPYLKYQRGLSAIRRAAVLPRETEPRVIWLHGDTGLGKTRKAIEMAVGEHGRDGYYIWRCGDKWWDGYDPQRHACVILDDLRAGASSEKRGGLAVVTPQLLLALFDRYAVRVEIKGDTREFCAELIIVTCDRSPDELFVAIGCNEPECTQLRRRVGHVCHVVNNLYGPPVGCRPKETEYERLARVYGI